MLTCSRCGYYNSDVATRCEQCNARLSQADAERPRHVAVAEAGPPSPLPPLKPQLEYGGFWIRFIAAWIDGFILTFATAFLIAAFPFAALGLIIALLMPPLYEILAEARSGATIGKRVFKLRVVRADNLQPIGIPRSIVRHLAHILSALIFFLGYVMAAFNHRKRALHDYIAGTVVIKDYDL
jgi:uncharacterized RDD family membrane protein YckC